MQSLSTHFRDGGWGMLPILACLALVLVVVVERALYLARAGGDAGPLLDAIERCLGAGESALAVRVCDRDTTSVGRVVRAAVLRAGEGRERVESAIYEATLGEVPRLHGRVRYLTALAQIATLLGMFGTLTGLVQGFGCLGHGGGPTIDPGRKAELIAGAMGEAMNCTAFGLATAIVALAAYGALDARTRAVLVALDEASACALRIASAAVASRDGGPA